MVQTHSLKKPKIVIIGGPTASGKSAFAVAALTISSLSLIAAIVTIILEFVFYDTFFLIPFTPFA